VSASRVLLRTDCFTITQILMDLSTEYSVSQFAVSSTAQSTFAKLKTSRLIFQESVSSNS
jgi:hypothetical protein